MIATLSSLFRTLIVSVLMLTLVAIGLGLSQQASDVRRPGRSDLVCVNGFYWKEASWSPRLLDPQNHSLRKLTLPADDRLDMATLSPWVNQENESQLVGRWIRRSGQDQDTISQEFGLARYSYPSGRVLDQIPTSIVPISPPCWYPGTESRVLFLAGDAQLYQFCFEDFSTKTLGMNSRQPSPIRWEIDPPGEGNVIIHDVCWPNVADWDSRLLVSLSVKQRQGDHMIYSPSQIWWLRLSLDGASIVDAGPVAGLDSREQTIDLKRPALGQTSDGQLSLAFLGREEPTRNYAIYLVPLEQDSDSGEPKALVHRARMIAETSAILAPVFSEDGKSLSYLIKDGRNGAQLRHHSLDKSPDTTFAWASIPHVP